MSGERRLRIAIILFLALACFVLVLASGAAAQEDEGENEEEDTLLDKLNDNQDTNGSWDNDFNTTVYAYKANTLDLDFDTGYVNGIELYGPYGTTAWTVKNYEDEIPVQTKAIIVGSSYPKSVNLSIGSPGDYTKFQINVKNEIIVEQRGDGSWNNDVGDTALVTYYLAGWEGTDDNYIRGIEWLQEYEDPKTHSWGSITDDSKAILALDSAGIDTEEEIAGLRLRQEQDGSFGGIEETSWATIALSIDSDEKNMECMDKAVQSLRSHDYDNNQDLALAALAEQNYEKAKMKEEPGGGSGSGFIPPPWMYVLSFLIIGSIILSYQLFARLERDGVLDGPRKDIYKYVTDHPGEHLANITKTLGLSSSSIRYHLSVLEGMDLIVTHKNGKYKRFYINKNGYSKYTNGNGYKHIMSALKNNTARNIVKFLLSHPRSNQKRVSRALDIHPSTVTWHTKRLEEAEIISKQKKGKEIHYSLNSDVQLRKVIGIIEGCPA
jgi:predicted transcriptional regulator